jgi:nucleotide-binding universal stress UspA family protein
MRAIAEYPALSVEMIERPRSILVAVDFAEASGRAVAIASTLAKRCGASLRLLHACAGETPPDNSAPGQPPASDARAGGDRERTTDFLIDFGRRHAAGPFTPLIDTGVPVEAILLESRASDLVVMGTHGRRGLSRWWLGSVAERVLRETTRPLLIVHAQMDESAPADVFDRVLVHASPPLKGATATQYANMLATCFGGAVAPEPLEPALERSRATLLVVSAPAVRCGAWLSNIGAPIVRFCEQPILFVPESTG